jgi:prefoldin alpha subunit
MSNEDEFRKLVIELRMLESTADSLQSRSTLINAAVIELNTALETLKGLGKKQINSPILVPIGGGSYIRAILNNVNTTVYGVGAGVAIEKTWEESRIGMENRLKDLEKTRRSIQQQLGQIIRRIQVDQNRLQEMSAKRRRDERR